MSLSDLITVSINEPTITYPPSNQPRHSYPWNASPRVFRWVVEDQGRVFSINPADSETQSWLIDNQETVLQIIERLGNQFIGCKSDKPAIYGYVGSFQAELHRAFPGETFQIKVGEYKQVITTSHEEFVEYHR